MTGMGCDYRVHRYVAGPGAGGLGEPDRQRKRLRRMLGERVVRVTVKPFMDMHTMSEERLTQCCVHVGTVAEDGGHQCAPFCAVQAWAPLAPASSRP